MAASALTKLDMESLLMSGHTSLAICYVGAAG